MDHGKVPSAVEKSKVLALQGIKLGSIEISRQSEGSRCGRRFSLETVILSEQSRNSLSFLSLF